MIAVQNYSVDQYNTLPMLNVARERFHEIDGQKLVEEKFLELFRRYDVDRTFGLAMVHRHFGLNEKERLVEFQDTSVPWSDADVMAKNSYITPANWEVTPEGIRPYEFKLRMTYEDLKPPQQIDFEDPNLQSFLEEFLELNNSVGATGLFGLCAYPGDDFRSRLEITEGRANINLPYHPFQMDKTVDAAWFFSPKLWEAKGKCVCIYSFSGRHKKHAWQG